MVIDYVFLLAVLFFYRCSAICVKPDLRPRYHLAPPQGWMNDPNGFSFFKGEYHLFYQYNPDSSFEPGIANWGHAKSKDLFHWEDLPIAMKPDQPYDISGVFSGSAIIVNDTMYLYYTGNINHPGETPDHEQHQALATSTDGVNVNKYKDNPIIEGADRQPNFRDPKVWQHGSKYYMVLGNSFANDTLGRVLLYTSEDLINWTEAAILAESKGDLGYMWECPDFFEINGYFVLLFSPQGIKPQGDKYRNLYQTGYIVGKFDYETNKFTQITKFVELDNGHDFYATQTIEDPKGRRLMVAWMDMWEQGYPERKDGWTGQMTLPRVLTLSRPSLKLIQKPVEEVFGVYGEKIYSGKANGDTYIKLDDNAAKVTVTASIMRDFALCIEGDGVNGTVTISYDYMKGEVTLDRGGEDGVRRTKWKPKNKLYWEIYIDASSIELFCGEGDKTFSSRFFPEGPVTLYLLHKSKAYDLSVFKMLQTVALPEPCKNN